ncbi:unnamed protein product [Parnassius apollo]|uniref:(apollo) hypothetical protein n=1 Tax=Parnassius apollo TaxID=110799 RepID=A0A8S3X5V1_PARAO|nr:unnamed protein product [Parnassius apollo]
MSVLGSETLTGYDLTVGPLTHMTSPWRGVPTTPVGNQVLGFLFEERVHHGQVSCSAGSENGFPLCVSLDVTIAAVETFILHLHLAHMTVQVAIQNDIVGQRYAA